MSSRVLAFVALLAAVPALAACNIGASGRPPTNPGWGASLPPAVGELPTLGSPGDPPRSPY